MELPFSRLLPPLLEGGEVEVVRPRDEDELHILDLDDVLLAQTVFLRETLAVDVDLLVPLVGHDPVFRAVAHDPGMDGTDPLRGEGDLDLCLASDAADRTGEGIHLAGIRPRHFVETGVLGDLAEVLILGDECPLEEVVVEDRRFLFPGFLHAATPGEPRKH